MALRKVSTPISDTLHYVPRKCGMPEAQLETLAECTNRKVTDHSLVMRYARIWSERCDGVT